MSNGVQSILECPYCGFHFNPSQKHLILEKCPACKLSDKIDEHIADILKNIIINYYAAYSFEPDLKSRFINTVFGFSSLQDRKNTRVIHYEHEVMKFKTFYLLISSHIEAAFYDIEAFLIKHKEFNSKDTLFEIFKCSETKDQNKIKLKDLKVSGRNEKIIHFIRHVANVIKHTSGVIHADSLSGKRLINYYGFSENESLYDHYESIKNLGKHIMIGEFYELGCIVHVFLRDIVASATGAKVLKIKSLNIVKSTNLLVNFQIRKNISNQLLEDLRSEGILSYEGHNFAFLSNNKISDYIDAKLEIIKGLIRHNYRDVVNFEVYGSCSYINNTLKKQMKIIGSILQFIRRKSSYKESPISADVLVNFLKSLTKSYSEELITQMFFNDYDKISKKILAQYILDFYYQLSLLKNSDKADIMRLVGFAPFLAWSPFMFSQNKANL